jgi:DNA-binding transcriptional ArsR family regulator
MVMPMEPFEPVPMQVVTDPQQLKAFTDPLRIRVINFLKQRAATNQQVADALGEPQAKVLYHIRFLLDAGLIRLVDQQIKGGNVEKYYRSVANLFALRPESGAEPLPLASAEIEAVQQEMAASQATWPDQWLPFELRRVRLPQERADEFYRRLVDLIAEYWGGPQSVTSADTALPDEDPTAPTLCFAAVIYRDPSESIEPRERGL